MENSEVCFKGRFNTPGRKEKKEGGHSPSFFRLIQEVAAILGHDKLDTTMQYAVLDKSDVKKFVSEIRVKQSGSSYFNTPQ